MGLPDRSGVRHQKSQRAANVGLGASVPGLFLLAKSRPLPCKGNGLVQAGGKRAHWRVRYWTGVLVAKGQVERKRKFLGYCSTTNEPTERKRRGEITIREAERLRNQLMEKVNSATQGIQSQIPLRDFLEIWFDKHVSTLGSGTQTK